MQIEFIPYDFEYKSKDGSVLLYLYSKLDDGTKVCVIHPYQPYFYAKYIQDIDSILNLQEKDGEKIAKVQAVEVVEKALIGKVKKFLKITVNYPKAVPLIAKSLEKKGLDCYEKDILFVHRYLRDNKIIPMTLSAAEGSFKKSRKLRVAQFIATAVKPVSKQTAESWKILAIDIETYNKSREIDFENNPILMIAFYGQDEEQNIFKKVITWKDFPHSLDYIEIVKNEEQLLQRFREEIITYSPQIITGYFTDGFDFPYLLARAGKFNVTLDLGLDESPLRIRSRAGLRSSEAAIRGILHLDLFKFIRNIFGGNLHTDSYSLDAVAKELLGETKEEVNLNELSTVWDERPGELESFVSYNLRDAYLTWQLCLKLLFDVIEFTRIIGLPAYDVTRMRFSRLVENYILRRAIGQEVIAPNKPSSQQIEQRRSASIQGAFVYQPTPGLYQNVAVFDFRSLYPTIISAHNIGPEGLNCKCCEQNKVPSRENIWFCSRDKKFIPSVLEHLILRRVGLKRLIKKSKQENKQTSLLEVRSYALKLLANSFYGYLGFFGARWYCLECAAATTAYARNYIQETIKKAADFGFKTIYADTDSCFVLLEDKILDKALEFMNEINFNLPGHMELEFEGNFKRALFVSVKGGDKGAKKKYALIDQEGEIKITGFEFVRRNWSELAKEVQREVIRLVLHDQKEEALQYVREMIIRLKERRIPRDKLILRTQITRDLSAYTSAGPHVKVARLLANKGINISPGTVIEYIIAKGQGSIGERAQIPREAKEYDVDYYLNNQLIPAVSSIFEVFAISEDELLGEGKQTGLGGYF